MCAQFFHSVIIASRGRPLVLKATLESIWKQSIQPDEIIISIVNDVDICPTIKNTTSQVIYSSPGLCAQRNIGMQFLDKRCALVSFLDDDLELGADYFKEIKSFFAQCNNAVGLNGNILVEGCSRLEAQDAFQKISSDYKAMKENLIESLYGCNMHYRRESIGQELFDERLSLYGWLEDFDFSTRVGQKGGLYWIPRAMLCHLKEPTGRMNNRKFGFAQIMNPFYLYKKNVIRISELIRYHLLPCAISNALKIATGSNVGKERFYGNLRAYRLILSGHCSPEEVAKL
jgi:glycosyltransferase involved in cell wall biosynthesis